MSGIGSGACCNSGGAQSTLRERKKVLVIMQPQRSFMGDYDQNGNHVDGDRPVLGAEGDLPMSKVIDNIIELINKAEKVKFDVITVVKDQHHSSNNDEEVARRGKHCVFGTPGIKLSSKIEAALAGCSVVMRRLFKGEEPDVITHSITTSSSYNSLITQLREMCRVKLSGAVSNVPLDFYVCGVTFPYAVSFTARDLMQQEFGDVYIISDACRSDSDAEAVKANAEKINAMFGIKSITMAQLSAN